MAYETGSATSPVDLMGKMATFATAQTGMTVNEEVNDGTRDILGLTIGTGFFSLGYAAGDDEYISLQHTSFVAATAWGAQANSTDSSSGNGCVTNLVPNTAISAYHFFFYTNGMFYVSFLTTEGNWRHLAFGDISKYGTYTGGAIIWNSFHSEGLTTTDDPGSSSHLMFPMASRGSTPQAPFVRCDYNTSNKMYRMRSVEATATRAWALFENNDPSATASQGWLMHCSPSSSTQASFSAVQQVFVDEGVTTNKLIPIGEMPDMRVFNMRFFNAGDTFDTDWLVFPCVVKRDPAIRDDLPNSGHFGVAFRNN